LMIYEMINPKTNGKTSKVICWFFYHKYYAS
jgi:hypothetical protein